MEVKFNRPRTYTIEIPKGSKIVNTYTDKIGDDWLTWVEFGTDATDSNEPSVTIRTLRVNASTDASDAESIVLYESDYNKLIGKK